MPTPKIPRKHRFLKNGSSRFLKRFWSNVEIKKPDECWPWKASKTAHGYGRVGLIGINTCAHRVAIEISSGVEVPAKLETCHSCDNPPCCNPAHLFVGTQSDNQQDSIRKGRRLATPPNPQGLPSRHLLDWQKVDEIRKTTDKIPCQSRRRRGLTCTIYNQLAKQYGVSYLTIERVANHRSWSERERKYYSEQQRIYKDRPKIDIATKQRKAAQAVLGPEKDEDW